MEDLRKVLEGIVGGENVKVHRVNSLATLTTYRLIL